MRIGLDKGLAAAALAGSLLTAGCVVEGEITGAEDDPTALAARRPGSGFVWGIVVLNGLNPESFFHADVQDHLVDFIEQEFVGYKGAAALMGPTAAGEEFLEYAARGGLDDVTAVSVPDGSGGNHTFKGRYGAVREWTKRVLKVAERERILTYVIASLNVKDLPAEIAIKAAYPPFDGALPKDFDFPEAVYGVIWEGRQPIFVVFPTREFMDFCGDWQLVARGRCGAVGAADCGLQVVEKTANSACRWDKAGNPLDCKMPDGTTVNNPALALGNVETCEI